MFLTSYEIDQYQAIGNTPVPDTSPPHWARQMAELLTSQAAQIQALQEALAHQHSLTKQDASGPTTLTPPQSTPTAKPLMEERQTSGSPVRKQESLLKPPEFDGNPADFRPWLIQMEAKLMVDKKDELESVRFCYTRNRLIIPNFR